MMALHKLLFLKYDTVTFSRTNYHLLDVLLLADFMYIFRPRILPMNFTADLGDFDDSHPYTNIYKADLSRLKADDINFEKSCFELPKKEYNLYKKDETNKIPIVLLNPTFGDTGNNNTSTIRSPDYYTSITYKCEHIQIGYIKKE